MEESQLLAATFNLPRSCRTIRQANSELHRWRNMLQGRGMLAFMGGIFEGISAEGSPVFHIHLILISTLPIAALSTAWVKLTNLPTGSVIKPLFDLSGWMNYVYQKNVAEALKHKLVNYREQLINKCPVFTKGDLS